MLENKRSRVYCFRAVRSYHRSRRSAPKTRSREARTMTEMGLFSTNRSNTSPSMAGLLSWWNCRRPIVPNLALPLNRWHRYQWYHPCLVHVAKDGQQVVELGLGQAG